MVPYVLSSLFGDKETLLIYSMMLQVRSARRPCPMCTSFLNSWNGTAVDLRNSVAIAVTARSAARRLADYKRQRGFANLPFISN